MLSDKFLEKYKNKIPPFGGSGLGELVYLRTYSRWLPDENRRENWRETVKRVVEYSIGLDPHPDIIEAESLYDNIFNLRVFPAGRTLWIGGTEAAKKYPMANFNCSFRVIDDYDAFWEIFYLLMLGCGTGFRILPSDVDKLAPLTVGTELRFISEDLYSQKLETTYVTNTGDDFVISVGDSKEGWIDALHHFFNLHQGPLNRLTINTFYVRPKGSILKTFGGRASGPEGLIEMFTNIHNIINRIPTKGNKIKLRPIDALDILNNIAYNVVSGGVRRSSQIALFDINDELVLNAKVGVYEKGHPNYGKYWRAMSNNSIYFTDKPNKSQLLDIFDRIEHSGEPGFLNSRAAQYRRPNFQGINPCAEILLDNKGVCNLTEINLMNCIVDNERWSGYHIDWDLLDTTIFHATRMGIRMTFLDLELPEWDKIQKRDRLIGVSLTGVQDCFDKLGVKDFNVIAELLNEIAKKATEYAEEYANQLRIPKPLLVTTIKPSGTISQLPTVSSGVHRSFAPFYIRRIRVTSTDPIAKVVETLNYPIFPETNQGPNRNDFLKLFYDEQKQILDKADTWVVEFPVKTNAKTASNDESAISQFDKYLLFNEHYTEHNTSVTITFSPDEVNNLVDHILKNWDNYVAVSFLKKDITYYNLLPYEQIDEDEYNKRKANIIDTPLKELLNQMENGIIDENLDPSCANGVCPVR